VNHHFVWVLESWNIVYNAQCAFQNRRSTLDHLVNVEYHIHSQSIVTIRCQLQSAINHLSWWALENGFPSQLKPNVYISRAWELCILVPLRPWVILLIHLFQRLSFRVSSLTVGNLTWDVCVLNAVTECFKSFMWPVLLCWR
jgi:hypothetical protein